MLGVSELEGGEDCEGVAVVEVAWGVESAEGDGLEADPVGFFGVAVFPVIVGDDAPCEGGLGGGLVVVDPFLGE